MKTDRELLELAARAAGLTPLHVDLQTSYLCVEGEREQFGRQRWYWNPLADDGDSLRLAAHLNLTIKIMDDHVKVGWRGCDEQWPGEDAPTRDEIFAATRRAIVRAAAQLAKDAS